MSHGNQPANQVTGLTATQVEEVGRLLTPHWRLVMRDEMKPLQDSVDALKRRSTFWGAVSGAFTSVLLYVVGRFTGTS